VGGGSSGGERVERKRVWAAARWKGEKKGYGGRGKGVGDWGFLGGEWKEEAMDGEEQEEARGRRWGWEEHGQGISLMGCNSLTEQSDRHGEACCEMPLCFNPAASDLSLNSPSSSSKSSSDFVPLNIDGLSEHLATCCMLTPPPSQ
jgi:hypothetical protein